MGVDDKLYQLALAFTRGVRPPLVWRMNERGVEPEEFFALPTEELIRRLEVKERDVPRTQYRDEALRKAREELKFINKSGIRLLALGCDGYPHRLEACPDAPLALFVIGEADLDADKTLSIVGTRKCTVYGQAFVDSVTSELVRAGVTPTIISGLAYGIDTAAHVAALREHLSTIAVVAHGLNLIYPPANRNLARDIVRNGGAIVSEYPSGTRPFRPHFLERNRIVAGLSDMTLVVESSIRGGAMSTARYAFEYDREVGAVPGRFNDETSEGCNHLIRSVRASLIASASHIMETMLWKGDPEIAMQIPEGDNLFGVLEGDSKYVYDLLKASREPVHISVLQAEIGIPTAAMLSMLGEMELDGLVKKLPGNKFVVV